MKKCGAFAYFYAEAESDPYEGCQFECEKEKGHEGNHEVKGKTDDRIPQKFCLVWGEKEL